MVGWERAGLDQLVGLGAGADEAGDEDGATEEGGDGLEHEHGTIPHHIFSLS